MLRMIGLDEHKLGMMALNVLVYLAEYLAKNFLGMESELDNEIPQYRSIVENEGIPINSIINLKYFIYWSSEFFIAV